MASAVKYIMIAVMGLAMFTMEMPQAQARNYGVRSVRRVVRPNYRRTVVRRSSYRAPVRFRGSRSGVYFGGRGISIRF